MARGRPEQERSLIPEADAQAGQVAGPAVVEALLALADGLDVAPAIEDRKRLAVLEDLVVLVGQRARRKDVVAAVDLDDGARVIGARDAIVGLGRHGSPQ